LPTTEGGLKVLHLKVNINEKIFEQVDPLVNACFDAGGSLLTSGTQISKEDTFVSLSMKNECRLISYGMGSVTGIPWKRSKINYDNSYQRLNDDKWESLKWIARRNVLFTGLMWFREYNAKDFMLKIKWKINGGDESQEYEVTRSDADRNMEDPWKVHYLDF
jgi:hypothetical protein